MPSWLVPTVTSVTDILWHQALTFRILRDFSGTGHHHSLGAEATYGAFHDA